MYDEKYIKGMQMIHSGLIGDVVVFAVTGSVMQTGVVRFLHQSWNARLTGDYTKRAPED